MGDVVKNSFEEKYGSLRWSEGDGYGSIHLIVPILLDGKPVDPETIDPALHEYLGTFRPPMPDNCCIVDDYARKIWKEGQLDRLMYGTKA